MNSGRPAATAVDAIIRSAVRRAAHPGGQRRVRRRGSGDPAGDLAASTDGGLDWFTAVTGAAKIDPGAPAADFLGFEDARVGRWLSDSHDIWTTHNGGQRWRAQPFR